jgi:acyl carrier protein
MNFYDQLLWGQKVSSLDLARDEPDFHEKLTEAFNVGLDLPAETDLTSLAFGQHRNWDSLGHMSLIAALEEAFGVSLSAAEVFGIDSYASAADVLRSKTLAGS